MALRSILAFTQNLTFLVILGLFGLALFSYFNRHETNFCEMTYMYENPVYHPVSIPSAIQSRYPRYGLYSYCEGVRCEAHRRKQFNGWPVLFIVGNADSYRQVRSLGSVAYRMGEEKNTTLDFFSIDFNEELSALFGGVLNQQTEFVRHSIETILALYKSNRTIILVGNSIGGLHSRAVFLKSLDPKLVRLIITQATPHQAPVIHSDSHVLDFYTDVNHYWRTEWNNSLKDLVLVSLAGGDRDHLVRSDLCSLKGLTDDQRSIDVLTSAVPHVWTWTDHRCIVWCRQLVLATTRALIEIIQEKHSTSHSMMKILRRYFLPSMKFKSDSKAIQMNSDKEPTLITQSTYSISRSTSQDYLILLKSTSFHTIIIHLNNARVFLKKEQTMHEITSGFVPIPPTYGQRKMLRLRVNESDSDGILIRTGNGAAQIDIYQIQDVEQIVELSTFTSKTLAFQKTGYVKLVFPSLIHLWQVYLVQLTSSNEKVPFLHFHVPWSHEDLYNVISNRHPSSPQQPLKKALYRQIRLKLHRPPPVDASFDGQYPSLELFLDPQSSYTVQIDSSFLDILSQLIRYYIFLLPTFLFTVLCVSFSMQIHDTRLRIYQTMLAWQVHFPFAFLLTLLYRLIIFVFPQSNFVVNLQDNGYYFFWLPTILYMVALSLWALISFLVDYLFFDSFRSFLYPFFIQTQNEFNHQITLAHWIQWFILLLPMLWTLIFSGSNGHIGLFVLVFCHTVWRGTINRRLQDILTTLLLFHGLLVLLNLTGFIIHIRSVFIQPFLPLCMIMSDPSLFSAICSILMFYCRFLFDRNPSKSIIRIKSILHRYAKVICVLLALGSQFYCSYSMSYLWIFSCLVFFHASMLFFVPSHQE